MACLTISHKSVLDLVKHLVNPELTMLELLLHFPLKSQVFVSFGRISAPVFESFFYREKKVSEVIKSLSDLQSSLLGR